MKCERHAKRSEKERTCLRFENVSKRRQSRIMEVLNSESHFTRKARQRKENSIGKSGIPALREI